MPVSDGINRRQFLTGSAAAAAMLMLGAEELRAEAPAASTPTGPPVGCGVIGLGARGRDILSALAKLPGAPIVGICDSYEPAHKRAMDIAPTTTAFKNYKQLLDQKGLDAFFIATPTYLHRQMALDAVAAGKHVYCEAPLASTVEDARAIATAGKGSAKIFQVGLQQRANPQVLHVRKFVETGALNQIAQTRSQWHRKTSWRKAGANADRDKDLNWRLNRATSSGLIGEVGVHHLDLANWFLKGMPLSAMGMGAIKAWQDGRDVNDTVQCLIEYPGGVQMTFDATLASSFDSSYSVYMGTDATILLKEDRAWMFKEADSPNLGWEVYARKDKIGDETGIALVADATKQLALGKTPGEEKQVTSANVELDELSNAVSDFLTNIRTSKKPEAGPVEGYQSAVVAIKANDAINTGSRITFQKEWFDLG